MSLEVQCVIDEAHDQTILCCAYNKLNNEVYSGGQDAKIKAWDGRTGKLQRIQKGHKGWVSDMVFISEARVLVTSSVDGSLFVWSDKGKELQQMDFGSAVFCMAFNAKRSTLAVGGNGSITIYHVTRPDPQDLNNLGKSSYIKVDSDSLKVLKTLTTISPHTDMIKGIVAADNGRIFSAGYDRTICMYDSERPKNAITRYDKCHEGAICTLTIDTDSNWLVTGSYDGSVKLWSQEGRCLDQFMGLADTVTGLVYVEATKTIWTTGKLKRISVFDPRTPANITKYINETSQLSDFSIFRLHQAQQSDTVVAVTTDRKLVVWKFNPCAAFRTLEGHRDWVEDMILVRRREDPAQEDSLTTQVYSAGADGILLRWAATTSANGDLYSVEEELEGHEGSVLCCTYSEDLDVLISGSDDLTIRIWDLGTPAMRLLEGKDGEEKENSNVLEGHEARITGLACCSDQVLVSVSHDRTMRFWDLHTRHEMDVVERAHDTPIHTLAYCEENEELATAAHEPIVKIWCSFKHSLKAVLSGHRMDVSQVRWCKWLNCWVTAAEDETIRLWDTDGVQLREFVYRGGTMTAMYVDNKRELLLCAMTDKAIRGYELEEGNLVCKYKGHTDQIQALHMLEEKGQYLSCSWDRTLRVWACPKGKGKEARVQDAAVVHEAVRDDEEEDEEYVSLYEREHPLVIPMALRGGKGMVQSLLKAARGKEQQEPPEPEKPDMTGLGGRLDELERALQRDQLESRERQRTPGQARGGSRSKAKSGTASTPQHRR